LIAVGGGAAIAITSTLRPSAADAVRAFAAGRGTRLALPTKNLDLESLKQALDTPIDSRFKLRDFVDSPEKLKPGPEIRLSREVVLTTERVIDAFRKSHPHSKVQGIRGWRGPDADRADGGTGFGPHVRGEAADLEVSAPRINPVSLARDLANTARKLGVRGVAVEQIGEHTFAVHLDPVRRSKWFAEQAWQNEAGPAGDPWRAYWHGGVEKNWRAANVAANADIAGTFTLTGKSGGIDENGTEWGFQLVGDGEYAITSLQYMRDGRTMPAGFRFPHVRPDSAGQYRFEYFDGRGPRPIVAWLDQSRTQLTMRVYNSPGSSRSFMGYWRKASDSLSLQLLDSSITRQGSHFFKNGIPITGDSTQNGGYYIDATTLDAPSYRESAPSYDDLPLSEVQSIFSDEGGSMEASLSPNEVDLAVTAAGVFVAVGLALATGGGLLPAILGEGMGAAATAIGGDAIGGAVGEAVSVAAGEPVATFGDAVLGGATDAANSISSTVAKDATRDALQPQAGDDGSFPVQPVGLPPDYSGISQRFVDSQAGVQSQAPATEPLATLNLPNNSQEILDGAQVPPQVVSPPSTAPVIDPNSNIDPGSAQIVSPPSSAPAVDPNAGSSSGVDGGQSDGGFGSDEGGFDGGD